MTLPVRKCGSQGFECAAQGLDCMGMSAGYVGFDTEEAQAESIKVLEKVLAHDKIMLDTIDVNGPHTNEELIGRVIAGRRDKFLIATKCGIRTTENGVVFESTPEDVKTQPGIDFIELCVG